MISASMARSVKVFSPFASCKFFVRHCPFSVLTAIVFFPQISKQCFDAFVKLFKQDSLGKVSLEVCWTQFFYCKTLLTHLGGTKLMAYNMGITFIIIWNKSWKHSTFLLSMHEACIAHHTQGCKLAPVIGHLSAKFEVLTGKLRSLIGHPDGPHLWRG